MPCAGSCTSSRITSKSLGTGTRQRSSKCRSHGCDVDLRRGGGRVRWNELKAEDVGLVLQFVPLVLGFFTYKAAMVARGGLDLFSEIASDRKSSESPAALESDASLQE